MLTLPGRGGILTRVDSRSRISRKISKSEYRLRTDDVRSLNAGILVCPVSPPAPIHRSLGLSSSKDTHHTDNLIVGVHLSTYAMCHGIPDFDLEKALGHGVHLVELIISLCFSARTRYTVSGPDSQRPPHCLQASCSRDLAHTV